ncbi:MAG: tetraacyldisaccharide 4'-kinase [Chitinivibrionales bacterium]|nr:tetraacyldisaccharide 4'-kinase [Chitinivibrionales bacterium]
MNGHKRDLRPLGAGLLPRALAALYVGAVRLRNALFDSIPAMSARSPMPVVSVGGIHAGGSGKTPLVALIAEHLLSRDIQVCVASRGYGRRSSKLCVVGPGERCDWTDVGDEPAMIHRRLPQTWLAVSPNRRRAIEAAAARMPGDRPRVALLDDGFQHRRVRRDLDIVCLPADPWQSLPLPAGYLREPLSALRRAHAVCIIGDESQREQLLRDAGRARRDYVNDNVFVLLQQVGPCVRLDTGEQLAEPPRTRLSVLCGIARPERFLRAVESLGVGTERAHVYPDHHIYTPADIETALAGDCGGLLTTEKDSVRISSLKLANQHTICYLSLRLAFVESGACGEFHDLLHSRTLQVRGSR